MRLTVNPQDVCDVVKEHWDDLPEEWKAIIESGRLPNEFIQLLTLHPQLFVSLANYVKNVFSKSLLDSALKEKLNLKVALIDSCTFTFDSSTEFVRHLLGSNESVVPGMIDADHMTPREQVAIEFAEALLKDSNQISDSTFAALRDQFEPNEIIELISLVGEFHKICMFCNALELNTHSKPYGRMTWDN